MKKTRKKSKKVQQPLLDLPIPPSHLLDQYHDLDLSEEFLAQVLKYVDDLCNFINNGDSNLERTMEINQNISNAVGFYRTKLHSIDTKQNMVSNSIRVLHSRGVFVFFALEAGASS